MTTLTTALNYCPEIAQNHMWSKVDYKSLKDYILFTRPTTMKMLNLESESTSTYFMLRGRSQTTFTRRGG